MKKLALWSVLLCLLLIFILPTNLRSVITNRQPEPIEELHQDSSYAPSGSVKVDPKIVNSSQVDGKWQVQIQASVKSLITTKEDVALTSEVYRLSDDQWYVVPFRDKKTILTKKLQLNSVETVTEKLSQLQEGYYKFVYYTSAKNSKSTAYNGCKEFAFTITKSGIEKGWQIQFPSIIPVQSASQLIPPASSGNVETSPQIISLQESGQEPEQETEQATEPVSSEINSTLKGKWGTYLANGKWSPVLFAMVEIAYSTKPNSWKTIATSHTDDQGNFTVSYPKPNDSTMWRIKMTLQNDYSKVEQRYASVYGAVYTHPDLANGGTIPDSLVIPRGSSVEKAAWLFEDILRSNRMLKPIKDPGKATIVWDLGNIDGYSHFDRLSGKIEINSDDYSKDFIIYHEIGHNYMSNLYQKWWPKQSCDGPHYFTKASNPGCAWTEGWSNFFALVVNRSSIFPGHILHVQDVNFEHVQKFEQKGDSVEGRVIGSLWDLYDTNNDGLDQANYSFQRIYRTIFDTRISNFNEFWEVWKTTDQSTKALNAIRQNGLLTQ
jgi:hypothetical protein